MQGRPVRSGASTRAPSGLARPYGTSPTRSPRAAPPAPGRARVNARARPGIQGNRCFSTFLQGRRRIGTPEPPAGRRLQRRPCTNNERTYKGLTMGLDAAPTAVPTAGPTAAPGLVLERLDVLVVDCQTTGATPERGHLLEVAWARTRAGATRPKVHATLVALPDGKRIPPRITELTGIDNADLASARPAGETWRRLEEEARRVAAASGLGTAPAVAHFARFERAFLAALHREHGEGRVFPLDLICTHEIACRLLPGLPRRGLRALAGYLGHRLGETKRAAAHVEATALVWSELASRLRTEHGVTTLEELRSWLERTPPSRRGGRDFALARETRLVLPDAPGVYRMLGRGGEVLYLGKAGSLKHRVNGYFQKRRHDRRHTLEMLTQVFSVDVTVTATPLEAALLETDEIKRHAPPYNVRLREHDPHAYFARDDLTDARPHPDAKHCLGPLPSPDALAGLTAVGEVLSVPSGKVSDAVWRCALDLADKAPLDRACLAEGLDLFLARHGGEPSSVGALLGLGARLWREWTAERERKRVEAAQDPDEAHEVEDDAQTDERRGARAPSTPEQACAALENALRRGAHLVRRGRWLRRLGESSLVWRPPTPGDGGRWRMLVVERGRVVRAADVMQGIVPSAPPGWPHSRLRRLEGFDAATYDRLRVLTTELRRLVAGGHDLQLCLGPRRHLDARALGRWLYWV